MRLAFPIATLGMFLYSTTPMAQQVKPADPPAPTGERTGPIVGGRHRQPTVTEVETRQRAEGESAKAIEERNREEDKVIDDLYKELMTPVPSGDLNGGSGQLAR